MFLSRFRAACLAASVLTLSACAGGGSPGSEPLSPAAQVLPDESGQVEWVQGEDPRKYFIANKRALNAVDADGDGVWDDVQQRLAADPISKKVDARALKQYVIARQNALLFKTRAQARVSPMPEAAAAACLNYRAQAAGASKGQANFLEIAR